MKRTICIILSAFLSITSYAADDLRLSTVVIDPGHGGHDPGAVSADRKTYEKNLVLDISKRLAAKIQEGYPDVKVILTRTKDEFISLADRADKANKANANLFISIHINASSSKSPNGYSLHLLGQSSNKDKDLFAYNMDVCKLENSVVMLEDDATKYEGFNPDDPESQIFALLMQSAYLEQGFKFAETVKKHLSGGPLKADRGIWQNPFYVLWKTAMPAVLLELGFISNSNDLACLVKTENREAIATKLYEAFKDYKYSYDGSIEVKKEEAPALQPENSAPAPVPVPDSEPEAGAVKYGVQIFAVSKVISSDSKEFMGYEPTIVKAGKINKYVIGVSSSLDEAKKNFSAIKKKYSDAFLVKISGGSTSLID